MDDKEKYLLEQTAKEYTDKGSSSSQSAIQTEEVKKIISNRKNGAKVGLGLVVLVTIAIAAVDPDSAVGTILIGIVIFLLLLPIYCINILNYPTPRPSYRTWNKLIYIYLAKLVIVFAIFRIVWNLKDLANPMRGFADPDALSVPEVLLDTTADAGLAVTAYAQLKPAEKVEEYFK